MSAEDGLREAIERLIAKWEACWCGTQLAWDHDPRVRDCPQHGSDDCRHMGEGIVTDLRALLAEHQPTAREAESYPNCLPSLGEPCGNCHRCQPAPVAREACTCSPYFGCSEYAADCPLHAQPAPVAPAGEVRQEDEPDLFADPAPVSVTTHSLYRMGYADALAAAEQRVDEAQAATWVGWELKVQELTDRAELAEQRVAAVRRLLRFEYVSAVDLAAALEEGDRG